MTSPLSANQFGSKSTSSVFVPPRLSHPINTGVSAEVGSPDPTMPGVQRTSAVNHGVTAESVTANPTAPGPTPSQFGNANV